MNKIQKILQTDKKPKEKVASITEMILNNKKAVSELLDLFKIGTDVEKGTCAEVMKFVSKESPEIMAPYIDLIMDYINCKIPRVKWGVPESIGNLSQKYPDEVEKAIPLLIKNTEDKSTVVRWCAAYALTEIAQYNFKKQKELLIKFDELIKTEQNNGVKNVYLKCLKNTKNNK